MPETTAPKKTNIVVKRIIDAPVELVWKTWTEPDHVMKWWGPQYYTSPSCVIDLRVGGKYIFCMRAPADQGGRDMYTSGNYTAIVPLERLEFTQGLSDKEGNRLEPSALGMPPDFPYELQMTVLFKRVKHDMTELTITEHGWTPGMMMVYSLAGMHQCMDKLSEEFGGR